MIPSAVFFAAVALQNKFPLQQIFEKSREHPNEVYTFIVDLGKVWKVYCRVPREKFCGYCGSTVLAGASCWPLSNYIPAQKIVPSSTELNHNCSALVLDSGNGVCCHHSSVYIRARYRTARGPNPTCKAISPGRNTFCQ